MAKNSLKNEKFYKAKSDEGYGLEKFDNFYSGISRAINKRKKMDSCWSPLNSPVSYKRQILQDKA